MVSILRYEAGIDLQDLQGRIQDLDLLGLSDLTESINRITATRLVLSLLNHLMIDGEVNPHSKGVWLPKEDTYVCACGIPIRWDNRTRAYVPR